MLIDLRARFSQLDTRYQLAMVIENFQTIEDRLMQVEVLDIIIKMDQKDFEILQQMLKKL